jgi:hypothetical protein
VSKTTNTEQTVDELPQVTVERKFISDNYGNEYLQTTLNCETSGAKYTIKKAGPQYSFFEVVVDKGQLPEELKGVYTHSMELEKKITRFLKHKKPTRLQKSKINYDKNHPTKV